MSAQSYLYRPRAPYAVDPQASRGRVHPETPSPTRTTFQRDRDRILHAAAFRRLAHKTQVFVYHEGDHFRTRLTHTLEVAQIARSIARVLGLDEDLAETVALAHDLGHPPFGHDGEKALDEAIAGYGGFDHNAQSLRVVTRLEHRYAAYDGLNLTWETLEGLVKHNGPLTDRAGTPVGRYADAGLPVALTEYAAAQDLELWSFASAEAQAAALADDIAYDAHDLDDGLRAGLFAIEDLDDVPFLASLRQEVDVLWPGLERPRLIHEVVRRVITRLVEDVIAESARRIEVLAPQSAGDIRGAPSAVVAFSAAMSEAEQDIKNFLYPHMYRHPRIARIKAEARTVVAELFDRYAAEPDLMSDDWGEGLADVPDGRRLRRVADFIAGMTDRYALEEHRRLFDATPELR